MQITNQTITEFANNLIPQIKLWGNRCFHCFSGTDEPIGAEDDIEECFGPGDLISFVPIDQLDDVAEHKHLLVLSDPTSTRDGHTYFTVVDFLGDIDKCPFGGARLRERFEIGESVGGARRIGTFDAFQGGFVYDNGEQQRIKEVAVTSLAEDIKKEQET